MGLLKWRLITLWNIAHMVRQPSEIPFDQKMNARVLCWIIGFLIFLETLALAGTVYVQRFIESWKTQTENAFTIELVQPSIPLSEPSSLTIEERQTSLLKALKAIPEIDRTEVIQIPQAKESTTTNLVKVTLHKLKHINFASLERDLSHLVGPVKVQDPLTFKASLIDIASLCFWIALAFSSLIVISTLGTITFVNHSNVALHEKVIDILRLIGATDRYIAKQFTKNNTAITFRGAIIALILSAVAYSFYCLSPLHDDSIVSSLKLMDKELIGVILGTPLFMLLMIYISSQMTILYALSKRI
ncbi:MAG: FtsX-like permease family protein [Caedimonadaceae bacterium]|nr:MAG: FtsX-like permease family protein [Caedimonadaceae bacterium]